MKTGKVFAAVTLLLIASIIYFAHAYGRTSISDSWSKLLAKLRAPDLDVRRKAAESLGELAYAFRSVKRTPELDKVMREHLKTLSALIRNKKEDPEIRVMLVHTLSLGEFGPILEVSIPSLLDVLRDETDNESVRSECVMVLPYVGPPRKIKTAILDATMDRSQMLRINAFQALHELAVDPGILFPLLAVASEDQDEQVRFSVVSLAGKQLKVKGDNRGLLLLLRASHDKSDKVRGLAAIFLRAIGSDEKDREVELVRLLKSADPEIRANSAAALMETRGGPAKYSTILIEMLRSKEAPEREAAANALIMSGPEARATIPALTDALNDPNELLRVLAATALVRLTDKASGHAPIILEALASKNEQVVWRAAGALDLVAQRNSAEISRLMEAATRHENSMVRAVALSMLGMHKWLNRAESIKLFVAALKDESSKVRAIALEMLGNMGSYAQPFLPQVKETLKDPSEKVRKAAELTIQKITGP